MQIGLSSRSFAAHIVHAGKQHNVHKKGWAGTSMFECLYERTLQRTWTSLAVWSPVQYGVRSFERRGTHRASTSTYLCFYRSQQEKHGNRTCLFSGYTEQRTNKTLLLVRPHIYMYTHTLFPDHWWRYDRTVLPRRSFADSHRNYVLRAGYQALSHSEAVV